MPADTYQKTSFHFGIYPGGITGTDNGLAIGPADNPLLIEKALAGLQSDMPLLVRCYVHYKGTGASFVSMPPDFKQYAKPGRKMDLVLCFQTEEEDLNGWFAFIRKNIEEYGTLLEKIQITEEANVNLPVLDGHYKNARRALVEGVKVAKAAIVQLGYDIKVGFNATPDFNPSRAFWKEIKELADDAFYKALDYVGLDFFPDVFRRVAEDGQPMDAKNVVRLVIQAYRETDMRDAGIDKNIPLHITENGWPTGEGRGEAQQAIMLEKIIRAIYALKDAFNITHYELFDLRDADSSVADIFYQFGLMKDDYTPKPAFDMYKRLIKELTIA